jgi:hypothetical protein
MDDSKADIISEVRALARRSLLEQVRSTKDQKERINYVRNFTVKLFHAAGVSIVDESSVHEDAIAIRLTSGTFPSNLPTLSDSRELRKALNDLLGVIESEGFMSENVAAMQQARRALAANVGRGW